MAFSAAAGCSFDYRGATLAEELGEEIPDTVVLGFSRTVVRDGRVILRLEAGEARSFTDSSTIVLVDVHFQELDSAGGVVAEGWVSNAVFHTDTENAETSGSVRIHSAREEASLEASDLVWEKEGRVLRALDEPVILRKDDGSLLQGRGFEADFRNRSVRFVHGVTGTIVDEDTAGPPAGDEDK
jgi:hypothetical protein